MRYGQLPPGSTWRPAPGSLVFKPHPLTFCGPKPVLNFQSWLSESRDGAP